MKKLASFAASLSLLALLLISSLPVGFAAAPRAPGPSSRIPTESQRGGAPTYQGAAQSCYPEHAVGEH